MSASEIFEAAVQGKASNLSNLLWFANPAEFLYYERNVPTPNDGELKLTALLAVACKGHTQCLEVLLKVGGDANHQDCKLGRTLLVWAAMNGHTATVECLIRAGANLHIPDFRGCTPLFMASRSGHTTIARLLIRAGSDVNAYGFDGEYTPLIAASMNGHTEVVKVLLPAGPNLEAVTKSSGDTALMRAAYYGRQWVVQALLRAGADKSAKNQAGKTAHDLTSSPEIKQMISSYVHVVDTDPVLVPPVPPRPAPAPAPSTASSATTPAPTPPGQQPGAPVTSAAAAREQELLQRIAELEGLLRTSLANNTALTQSNAALSSAYTTLAQKVHGTSTTISSTNAIALTPEEE